MKMVIVACAVQLGEFLQAVRNSCHVGPDNQHVESAEHTGHDIYPEAVGQVQSLIKQEHGIRPPLNIHGNHPEQGKLAFEQKTLPADDEGQESVSGQGRQRTDKGTGDGNNGAVYQVVFMDNRFVILQGPLPRGTDKFRRAGHRCRHLTRLPGVFSTGYRGDKLQRRS